MPPSMQNLRVFKLQASYIISIHATSYHIRRSSRSPLLPLVLAQIIDAKSVAENISTSLSKIIVIFAHVPILFQITKIVI